MKSKQELYWFAVVALIASSSLACHQRTAEAPAPLQASPLATPADAEMHPALSPDGSQMAFAWSGPAKENRDIYIQTIGSGSPLRLTTDAATDYGPAWSPDGRSIAFLRGLGPGRSELRLLALQGGADRKLSEIRVRSTSSLAQYPAWSPDSRFLVVTDSPGEGRPDALFVVAVDTGEKKQLTDPQSPIVGDTMPAVAADGRSLVFLRVTIAPSGELQLLPLGENLTASGPSQRLTPATLNAQYPAWLPSSKEIAFSGRGRIWRVAVDGQTPPARLPVGEWGTALTISRSRLVYVRSFTDYKIWRIDTPAVGSPASSPPSIAIDSAGTDRNPQISPDGRRVVFPSDRAGEQEIWVADLDGKNAVQATSMGAPTGTPHWSPDGQSIAFHSVLEGQYEIYVVPATGGAARRLTTHQANDHVPSFSHDGKWVYFSSNRSGGYQIWKAPFAGGEAVQVTQNTGYVAAESPDGAFLYYTQVASGPSGLWRMPTSGGRPEKVLDGVIQRAFAVLKDGVYYIDQPAGSDPRLQFHNFRSGKSMTVASLGRNVYLGLTASPDGRMILYTKSEDPKNELMLVENFR